MLVRLNSTLRGQSGRHAVTLDLPAGASVAEALAALIAQAPSLAPLLFDGEGRLRPQIVIFHNGRNIELGDGLDTRLEPAHALDLFPRAGLQRAFADD